MWNRLIQATNFVYDRLILIKMWMTVFAIVVLDENLILMCSAVKWSVHRLHSAWAGRSKLGGNDAELQIHHHHDSYYGSHLHGQTCLKPGYRLKKNGQQFPLACVTLSPRAQDSFLQSPYLSSSGNPNPGASPHQLVLTFARRTSLGRSKLDTRKFHSELRYYMLLRSSWLLP